MRTQEQLIVSIGCVIGSRGILIGTRYMPGVEGAHGRLEFPGGKIEFGEDPRDAVKREVKEETGLEVTVGEIIPVTHFNKWVLPEKDLQVFVLGYLCFPKLEQESTIIEEAGAESRDWQWLQWNEIDMSKTIPGLEVFLTWLRSERSGQYPHLFQ